MVTRQNICSRICIAKSESFRRPRIHPATGPTVKGHVARNKHGLIKHDDMQVKHDLSKQASRGGSRPLPWAGAGGGGGGGAGAKALFRGASVATGARTRGGLLSPNGLWPQQGIVGVAAASGRSGGATKHQPMADALLLLPQRQPRGPGCRPLQQVRASAGTAHCWARPQHQRNALRAGATCRKSVARAAS